MRITTTILNGASLSAAVDLGANCRLKALLMPAAWTAADITFQVSEDNTNFFDMMGDDGNAVKLTGPAAGRWIGLRNDVARAMMRVRYLKVQSGVPGTLVTQGADRIMTLLADDPNRV